MNIESVDHALRCQIAGLSLALASLVLASSSFASTVKQLTFEELCGGAEFIFEGRPIESETREDDSHYGFGTYIRFEVLDRLKGPDVGGEIELRFSGGTLGSRRLSIADMRLPKVGEVGVYFIESLEERLVNPILGWSQGHFVELIDETGRKGIYTPGHSAVLAVQAETPPLQSAAKSSQLKTASGKGVAKGILVSSSKTPSVAALSVRAFKDHISNSVLRHNVSGT